MQLTEEVTGLLIGLMTDGFVDAEEDVAEVVKAAAYSLRQLGAEVEEFSFPELNHCT